MNNDELYENLNYLTVAMKELGDWLDNKSLVLDAMLKDYTRDELDNMDEDHAKELYETYAEQLGVC